MSPAHAMKAATLEVFPQGNGVFVVPGDTAVHDINPDRETGELRCDCDAGKHRRPCSHVTVVVDFLKAQRHG
jgi:hypothetical protein